MSVRISIFTNNRRFLSAPAALSPASGFLLWAVPCPLFGWRAFANLGIIGALYKSPRRGPETNAFLIDFVSCADLVLIVGWVLIGVGHSQLWRFTVKQTVVSFIRSLGLLKSEFPAQSRRGGRFCVNVVTSAP